ncbi:hypothetical protein GCM10023354_01370 [Garicola koreensis]|uniref:hypothetical protein n=1 Tax=Garicola koreensis TaxID=1262554 RepID=UPI0031ED74CE
MDLDAIIGISLPAVVIILITIVVSLFRRRRMRRRQEESVSGEVYSSPMILLATGWVVAVLGLILGVSGVALQGSDGDALPMMIIGAGLAVVGVALIERAGSVFWLTDTAVAYKKPFRSGTIPYVDIRDYRWSTSTTGGRHRTAAHVTVTQSNGRKTRFNIAFQHHIDFSPLHQWAEANQRRDLLPEGCDTPVSASEAGPVHQIPRLY